ncbi:hypothetical protein MNBD_GAMMA15-2276 [hydrothermal vent metagenome]|uniref:FMN-binding domain-containing protein n=1 Tax=hydrothermal vent metagenome TaxID=652676 RepID=A0A3B0YXE6_9ZZZZ
MRPTSLRFFVLLSLMPLLVWARGTYQEPQDFLSDSFDGQAPEASIVWLIGERKLAAREILGHDYSSLRVRYWRKENRSAWILEEIGKDHPITMGVVIQDGRLERIKVLVFRESRGWEIRHPFFTRQFQDARLNNDGRLDRSIDGISGATLSVRAMKKIATLALYLDSTTGKQDVETAP